MSDNSAATKMFLIGLLIALSIFIGLVWTTSSPIGDEQVPEYHDTPETLVTESFEALKQHDFMKYSLLYHPSELDRFKRFAESLFKSKNRSESVKKNRKLFLPFDSAEDISQAAKENIFAIFIENSVNSIPDFDKLMADAKLEILGRITETPQTVHVIAGTVMPRPSPLSCQKFNGRWYLFHKEDINKLISNFEKSEFSNKNNLNITEAISKTEIGKIEVLGHVMDGKDLAQVLCRVNIKIADFQMTLFACYPIRENDPAWSHLNDKDKTNISNALRSKWERK